jgi:hypothetical protein
VEFKFTADCVIKAKNIKEALSQLAIYFQAASEDKTDMDGGVNTGLIIEGVAQLKPVESDTWSIAVSKPEECIGVSADTVIPHDINNNICFVAGEKGANKGVLDND